MPKLRPGLARHVQIVIVASIGIAGPLVVTGSALGQKRDVNPAPARNVQAVDLAREAMQREVEAKARETGAMFARLKAIPIPVPVPQPQFQVLARPQPAFPADRPVLIEEVDWATDADDDDGPAQPVVMYTDQAFDIYAFSGTRNAQAWQLHQYELLEREVERVASGRRLSTAQKEKLRLAGKGDIKRHVDWIESKRKQFETVRRDRQKGRELLMEVRAFANTTRSQPWTEKSFYNKVLKKIDQDRKEAGDDPKADKPLPGSELDLRKVDSSARS